MLHSIFHGFKNRKCLSILNLGVECECEGSRGVYLCVSCVGMLNILHLSGNLCTSASLSCNDIVCMINLIALLESVCLCVCVCSDMFNTACGFLFLFFILISTFLTLMSTINMVLMTVCHVSVNILMTVCHVNVNIFL